MTHRQELESIQQSGISRTQPSWRTAFGMLALVLSLALLTPGARAGGTFEWATAMGGWGVDWGNGIAVDGAGNVYTTGYFNGTAQFGPIQLTAAGNVALFVAKQAPDGTFLWVRTMDGVSQQFRMYIAVDATGNVYTTGDFSGTVDFDPGPGTFELTSAGGSDIFVSKLNTDGQFVWARAMGGVDNAQGRCIAVDDAGNVYTTGNFKGVADFDPGPGSFNLTSAGLQGIFVSKLDTNGDFVWARAMSGEGYAVSRRIAVDAAGNVYTTGYFSGKVDLDPGSGTFELTDSSFVSKLDANGDFLWARAMKVAIYDIAVDTAGNVHTTGSFSGTVDFDPGPDTFRLTSGAMSDIFVSKLDTDGNFLWARAMGAEDTNWWSNFGNAIAVNTAGQVYTTGHFAGTVDFDPGPGAFHLAPEGDFHIFVSKLDANGHFVWARSIGGAGIGAGDGIAVDAANNVYITGWFNDMADFNPGPGTFNLTSAGHEDIFVLKLSDASDTIPPNAIVITSSVTGPTNAATVDFTVTFDEDVQGFEDASDLIITHTGTAHTGAAITGGPVAYTVTVEGISGDGSFTLAVDTSSGVSDLAGNVLASSVTSAPVVIDNTPPLVTVLGVSPHALAPGDTALIHFAVNEMLLGDPVVQVAGTQAAPAPLESTKSLGHTYAWTAPTDLPVGQITGRPFIPGLGYFNPDPWPYGPQPLQITVTDLAGNTITHTEPQAIALISGLPAAWPLLAALALLSAAAFTLRTKRRTIAQE